MFCCSKKWKSCTKELRSLSLRHLTIKLNNEPMYLLFKSLKWRIMLVVIITTTLFLFKGLNFCDLTTGYVCFSCPVKHQLWKQLTVKEESFWKRSIWSQIIGLFVKGVIFTVLANVTRKRRYHNARPAKLLCDRVCDDDCWFAVSCYRSQLSSQQGCD